MARFGLRSRSEETQDYLITVGDLMAGLVFLFVITLMVFAFRFQQETEEIQSAEETRTHILEQLRERLEAEGLKVSIDPNQGVLRLSDAEETIGFAFASEKIFDEHIGRVEILTRVLSDVVPCFSGATELRCNIGDLDRSRYAASIHALNIEGHTDTIPFSERSSSRFSGNLELSAARAAYIHGLILEFQPRMSTLLNSDSVPILGVAGYGEHRRLPELPGDDDGQRRIDLRFIMEPPRPAEAPRPVQAVEQGLGIGADDE